MPDDASVLAAFPDAPVDHDNVDLYRGVLDRRLLLNRCDDCGHWHAPPRPICPQCWSRDVRATEVSGLGVVHALIWLHPSRSTSDGSAPPDALATVELDEQRGLRFTASLIGCPADEMRIGLAVRVGWIERDGRIEPAFVPAASTAPA